MLGEISRLREALLLYHEAWNGCEGNWRKAMRAASRNADRVLYPNSMIRRLFGYPNETMSTHKDDQRPKHSPSPPAAGSDLLDELESMARQHCYTDRTQKTYQGVPEINTTDSGALSADSEALRTLAQHGRFRIIREYGRMVVGYWPENDPNAQAEPPEDRR